jgi:diguanylate cyclase (GGDEF)-like protein
MTDFHLDLQIAERNRTLFLLDARIAAARVELLRLRGPGPDGERRAVSRHDARLVHANERLVLSLLDASTAAEAAAALGQRDALTGIPNRGLVLDRLETALASARRNRRKLGVLFVDLDAFKSINDTHGHAAGDRALQLAARRLTASVRASDTVGRFGGDEFLAILPDIEGPVDASLVAAKIVSSLAAPNADGDGAQPLTASVGIAIYPQDAASGAELVELADQAMYRAKARGSGHIEFHDAAAPQPSAVAASNARGRRHPPSLADLRDANEHLVLAALAAQGLQGKAEDIHHRQVMFLAMVAHELRNPLNPIRAAAELLQHASTNQELLAQVQGILRRQVVHLARLVDDLLDGARASTGKFRLECSAVSLRDILDPVVDAIRPATIARRQALALRLSPVAMAVHADPVRLTQVFTNLLDNASKYTAHGGEIGVDLEPTGDGLSATLRVTDNGIGISAEALPHIFDLFVQETHARAHDGQGLGIGLAIVRELVQAHGGTLFAASAGRGLGSRFVVTLPTLAAVVTAPEATPRAN